MAKKNYATQTQQGSKNSSKRKRGNSNKPKAQAVEKPVNTVAEITANKKFANDPNWYFTNKDVASQAANFSMNRIIGASPIKLASTANGDLNLGVANVIQMNFNPSPGIGAHQHGLNMAAKQLYTSISMSSGRTANYTPDDLSILMLAFGSVIECIEHCRRAFGLYTYYNSRNFNMPSVVFRAMNIDYDDFAQNYASYLAKANAIITKFNSMPVIGQMPWFTKCANIYRTVYKDADDLMASVVVPTPLSMWKLEEKTETTGSKLVTVMFSSDETMESILSKIDTSIDALLLSATMNYVYPDMLNLVDKKGYTLFKIPYFSDGYMVDPEYNEGFLLQMHNASITGLPVTNNVPTGYTAGNDVIADVETTDLVYNPYFNVGLQPSDSFKSLETVLDFWQGDITMEHRIEATRYATVRELKTVGSKKAWMPVELSDHYLAYMTTFVGTTTVNNVIKTYEMSIFSNLLGPDSTGSAYSLTDLFPLLSLIQYDWAPIMWLWNDTTPGIYRWLMPLQDIDQFCTVDASILGRINTMAAQSLFTADQTLSLMNNK